VMAIGDSRVRRGRSFRGLVDRALGPGVGRMAGSGGPRRVFADFYNPPCRGCRSGVGSCERDGFQKRPGENWRGSGAAHDLLTWWSCVSAEEAPAKRFRDSKWRRDGTIVGTFHSGRSDKMRKEKNGAMGADAVQERPSQKMALTMRRALEEHSIAPARVVATYRRRRRLRWLPASCHEVEEEAASSFWFLHLKGRNADHAPIKELADNARSPCEATAPKMASAARMIAGASRS